MRTARVSPRSYAQFDRPLHKLVGRVLLEIRNEMDLSLGHAAMIGGFYPTNLMKHERGDRPISVAQLRSYLAAYGVSWELFGEKMHRLDAIRPRDIDGARLKRLRRERESLHLNRYTVRLVFACVATALKWAASRLGDRNHGAGSAPPPGSESPPTSPPRWIFFDSDLPESFFTGESERAREIAAGAEWTRGPLDDEENPEEADIEVLRFALPRLYAAVKWATTKAPEPAPESDSEGGANLLEPPAGRHLQLISSSVKTGRPHRIAATTGPSSEQR